MEEMKTYAAMAKIGLTEDEAARLLPVASKLEQSFASLQAVDTQGVEPLVTVLTARSVMRGDVAVQMLPREEVLANAPEQADGYFIVPRTLE